jgi:tetratricopeptide (TPR) repeat protein
MAINYYCRVIRRKGEPMKLVKSADLERLHYAATKYKLNGQYALAEEAFVKIVILEEQIFGGETSSVALALYNIAELMFLQRNHKGGREVLRKAVEIWEHAHPNDYLSLLSYTEAVNKMNRQQSSVVALSPKRNIVAA